MTQWECRHLKLKPESFGALIEIDSGPLGLVVKVEQGGIEVQGFVLLVVRSSQFERRTRVAYLITVEFGKNYLHDQITCLDFTCFPGLNPTHCQQ